MFVWPCNFLSMVAPRMRVILGSKFPASASQLNSITSRKDKNFLLAKSLFSCFWAGWAKKRKIILKINRISHLRKFSSPKFD